MSSFILIHGGGHGGWCWERITPLLENHGHHVVTPDLPGLGSDRTPPSEVSLERWGRFVADLVEAGSDPVILAGHSLGGLAISQAAEYIPERVMVLVYISALLPRNGLSAFDLVSKVELPDGERLLQTSPSADGQLLIIDPGSARAAFYGKTQDGWVERALARLVPQPAAINAMPMQLSAGRFGAVPRVFVECLRDRAIPLRLQRSMQLASPCETVFAIDTDHSPFYSAPAELAEHLLSVAAQYSRVAT
jgi:pimeloyl-ACP methyl ester carboxylesterase